MTITLTNEKKLTILVLAGRLDTNTAPELETALKPLLAQGKDLVLDFAALEYVSSAGLRVLLTAQKAVQKSASKMIIRHVNDTINDIFELTGFADILTIE